MAFELRNWRYAGPWLAIATAPASLMLGGGVAQQMAFGQVALAIGLGTLVLLLLSTLQGHQGAAHHRTLVELARPVLGYRIARWTNTVLISILMVGWAAFGIGVVGASLSQLLPLPEPLAFVLWAALLVLGLWHGIVHGSLIALLSSLATLVLMGWGVLQASTFEQTLSALPATGTVFTGASLVIGYGAAFSLRSADFTQHVEPRRVVWISLLGLCLPLFVVSFAGAWLYHATGTWDLSRVLSALGFPALAHLFVVLGFLGAGLSNMHSGSLALQDLLRCPRERALLVLAGLSVVLAWLDFEQAMVLWLQFLSIGVVPLIGVILAHYGLKISGEKPVNWPGLLAWGLGVLFGLIVPNTWPGALVGVTVSALSYAFMTKLTQRLFSFERGDPL